MRLLLLLIGILALPSVLGLTDLVSPPDGKVLKNPVVLSFQTDQATSCSLIIDGQQTGNSVMTDANVPAQFNVTIAEGQHEWTVSCGADQPQARRIILDNTPPTMTGVTPIEGSTADAGSVAFSWSTAEFAQCILTVGNIVADSTSGTSHAKAMNLQPGTYSWHATCTDTAGNNFELQSRTLIVTEPFFLSISASKQSYSISESPQVTVAAASDATVNLYLFKSIQSYQDFISNGNGFCYDCDVIGTITGPFPITRTLPIQNLSGTKYAYAIAQRGNDRAERAVSFEVDNDIEVTITGSNSILVGNQTTLGGAAIGGMPPYTYSWRLHNGTAVTGNTVTLKGLLVGSYEETFVARDRFGNEKSKSLTITVSEEYEVTVVVLDSESNSPLADALVTIEDGKTLRSGTDGTVTDAVASGTKRIFVSRQGYVSKSEQRRIEEDTSLTFSLERKNVGAGLHLLDPPAGALLNPGNVQLRFGVNISSGVLNCTVFAGTDWLESKGSFRIASSGIYSSTLETGVGDYSWQVVCEGAQHLESDTRNFKVTGQDAFDTGEVSTAQAQFSPSNGESDFRDVIENAYTTYDQFDADQRSAADAIGFMKSLDTASKTVLRGLRDANDIMYRSDLSATQKDEEKKKIAQALDQLPDDTVTDLEVRKKDTFIKFVKDEDIVDLVENNKDTFPGLSKITKQLSALQAKLSSSTTIIQSTLVYGSGRKEDVTIIIHDITLKNTSEDMFIVVNIPKDIASSASDIIVFGNEYKVLKDDPILSFSQTDKIVYALKGFLSTPDVQKVSTILATENPGMLSKLTGASVQRAKKPSIDAKVMLIALIVLLASLYIAHYFDAFEKVTKAARRKSSDGTVRVSDLVQDAMNALTVGDYEKAVLIYREVRLAFERMPAEDQDAVFNETVLLCNELDLNYVRQVVSRVDGALISSDTQLARQEYPKMQGSFERLPREFQERVYQDVLRLQRRLNQ
jgi:hypothetical protein